jgi:hypothetical protein
LDGNNNLGHKCIVNFFSHTFSTNCVGRWYLIINNAKSFKKFFLFRFISPERHCEPKNLEIEIVEVLRLFLIGCFVITPLPTWV